MGLAASQARLLLLTARKSDLEFRAQQITNAEMILAMQTEEIARTYSNKLSNQTLRYIDQASQTEIEVTADRDTTLDELEITSRDVNIYNKDGTLINNFTLDGSDSISKFLSIYIYLFIIYKC